MSESYISICIPAYKRVKYLERLLDSIIIQTFTKYEIILSDDSNDNTVKDFIKKYEGKLSIIYFKNVPSLGTSANWNFAISKATGEWIKLMHDDDWFSSKESLRIYAEKATSNHNLIFSAYNNIYSGKKKNQRVTLSFLMNRSIKRNPDVLLLNNLIGPPSVTLIHRSIVEKYDENLKWRVDTDFYVRVLKLANRFEYIDTPLINIGISESQITLSCINNPNVELPEAFILIKKHGLKSLNNIIVYDAWWRLLRNMKIRKQEELHKYVNQKWPLTINLIAKDLGSAPSSIFKSGFISKIFMIFSYYRNLSKIKKIE